MKPTKADTFAMELHLSTRRNWGNSKLIQFLQKDNCLIMDMLEEFNPEYYATVKMQSINKPLSVKRFVTLFFEDNLTSMRLLLELPEKQARELCFLPYANFGEGILMHALSAPKTRAKYREITDLIIGNLYAIKNYDSLLHQMHTYEMPEIAKNIYTQELNKQIVIPKIKKPVSALQSIQNRYELADIPTLIKLRTDLAVAIRKILEPEFSEKPINIFVSGFILKIPIMHWFETYEMCKPTAIVGLPRWFTEFSIPIPEYARHKQSYVRQLREEYSTQIRASEAAEKYVAYITEEKKFPIIEYITPLVMYDSLNS